MSIVLLSGGPVFSAESQNDKTNTVNNAGIISQYSDNILGNYTEKNGFRQRISLNGVWKIALCEKPDAPLPVTASDFGYTVVPSSWMRPADFPIFGNNKFKPGKWNGDTTFGGKLLKDFPCAWYLREFKTPPGIGGRDVFLMLDNAIISAEIFFNGKNIGRQSEREDVRWNINDAIKPEGEVNSLSIRVTALLDEQLKVYLGGDQTVTSKISATLGGITGDVWLISEPRPARIADVCVRTSVRNREISFDMGIEKAAAANKAAVTADIFETDGKTPVISFIKDLEFDGKAGLQKFTFGGKWLNPVLWDLDNPRLYRLRISLSSEGEKIDESLPVTFGFREVWIDGKDILLNGKPLHLFAGHMAGGDSFVSAASKNAEWKIRLHRLAGYNSVMLGSEGTFKKGNSAQYYDDIFNFADRNGIPVILPIAPVYSLNWNDSQAKDKWKRETARLINKYRNHPSLLMYSLNFNYLGYPWDMNPYTWDCKYYPPDKLLDLGRKRKESLESEEFVKSIDPSTIAYHHASGNFGSMLTSNFYISWPPLQEREDYPSKWRAEGGKPFFAVEFACPSEMDYFRARAGDYEGVRHSEMLEAEYACQSLGPAAYRLQSDKYLEILSNGATADKKAGADRYDIYQKYTWAYNLHMHEPVESHIKAIYPQYLRSWRTYGVSGMSPNSDWIESSRLEPWHGKAVDHVYTDLTAPGPKPFVSHITTGNEVPSSLGREIGKALRPVLIYVGGSRDEGFSAKDHAYFANEKVRKQIVVVNGARTDLKVKVKWMLKDAMTQETIAEDTENIDAPAGESAFSQIKFTAPDVKDKREYLITLSVPELKGVESDIGGLAIQVFPGNPAKLSGIRVAVLDPENSLGGILDRMGVSYDKIVKSTDLKAYNMIVAGRNALADKSNTLIGKIMKSVCEDGKSLLCFEQKDLGVFGLRTHPRGVRKAFILQGGHPALQGLDEKDIENWRGGYSLLEAYPQSRSQEDIYPEEPWRWGNSGSLCSYMIEKPHTGAFKSVLECEFDLNYTPLAEFAEGKGRVILSQLDITGRFEKDPAAAKFAENLIRYGSEIKPAAKPAVACFSETGLMKSLGIVTRSDKKPEIIICDDEKSLTQDRKQQIARLVESGGTAFLIGQGLMRDLSWLPKPVKTEKSSFYYRAEPERNAAMANGLGISDLFLKDKRADFLPVGSEGLIHVSKPALVSEMACGSGKFVLFAVHPFEYAKPKVSPERMTRNYQKLSRSICILLSNLGVEFKPLSEKYVSGRIADDISLPQVWKFRTDPENRGMRSGWMDPDFDDSKWKGLNVPGFWENQGVTDANPQFPDSKKPYDGYAWYRCKVVVPEYCKGRNLSLLLGAVDDMDVTYFNGVQIGSIGSETNDSYVAVRDYGIPEKTIRFGKENTIAVKVYDNLGGGGIAGPELKIHAVTDDSYPYLNVKPLFNPYKLTRW